MGNSIIRYSVTGCAESFALENQIYGAGQWPAWEGGDTRTPAYFRVDAP